MGCGRAFNSEVLSRCAVVESVAVRVLVESAMRITGSLERDGSLRSLAVLTIELLSEDHVGCARADFSFWVRRSRVSCATLERANDNGERNTLAASKTVSFFRLVCFIRLIDRTNRRAG